MRSFTRLAVTVLRPTSQVIQRVARARAIAGVIILFGLGAGALWAYPPPSTPKLFVNEECEPPVLVQFPRRGAKVAIILAQGLIDPDDDGLLNPDVLRVALEANVSTRYKGPVCLDWEGTVMYHLTFPTNHPFHIMAVTEMVEALELAREVRPDAKFGFYNLPMGSYEGGPYWEQMQVAMQPILDASDCLFPSIYDMFATGEALHDPANDLAYVRQTVALALELANGKPVYPYMWPRYHYGNSENGLKLIPEAEFKSHVQAAFDARYEGRRANGIVWWGDDQYFYWLGQQNYPPNHPHYAISQQCNKVFEEEILPGETVHQHFVRIHKATLRHFAEAIQDLK